MHSLQTALIYVQSDLTCFALLRFRGFSHHFLNFCTSGSVWQPKDLMREFSYMQDAKNMQAFCQLLSLFVAPCFLMSGCYNLHTGSKKGSLLHLHHSRGGKNSARTRCWEQTVRALKLPNFESNMTSCCSSSPRTRSLHNACYKINSVYSVSWTAYFKLWYMCSKPTARAWESEISVHPAFPEKPLYVQLFFPSNKWHTFPRSCGCQSWDWVSVAHLLISGLPVSRPLNQLWNKPARAF